MRARAASCCSSVAEKATWFTHTGKPTPVEMALSQPSRSPTPCTSKKAMQLPSPVS